MWAGLSSLIHGQEIPRPSIARQKEIRPPPTDYNVRVGKILFLANAGLGLEYNDNVGQTESAKESDLVLTPTLGIRAVWQITKLNTLELQSSISYTKYLSHPELDTQSLLISPDSEVRLNVYVGDFRITLYDRFSIQQDPATQNSVSGVASIGRIINDAGVRLLWDLNDVIATLGYNHLTLRTTGATTTTGGDQPDNVDFLNRNTNQVSTSISFRTGLSAVSGLEATAARTEYQTGALPAYSSASVGPFFNAQLTRYTSLLFSAGYRAYFTDALPTATTTTDPLSPASSQNGSASSGSIYASLGLIHRLNRYYSDRLSFTRDALVGLYGDLSETNTLAYDSAWSIGRQLTLSTGLLFQDVHQVATPLAATASTRYQLFGGSLGTNYNLTKHLNLSLGYQLTIKLAGEPGQSYSQNRMRVGFQYQF